jgi:CBS domain-containing protein
VAHDLPASTASGDLANSTPLTIDIDATVEEAGQRMLACGVRHLVVTRGDQAVGVLSMRDVLRLVLAGPSGAVGRLVVEEGPGGRPEHWWG